MSSDRRQTGWSQQRPTSGARPMSWGTPGHQRRPSCVSCAAMAAASWCALWTGLRVVIAARQPGDERPEPRDVGPGRLPVRAGGRLEVTLRLEKAEAPRASR